MLEYNEIEGTAVEVPAGTEYVPPQQQQITLNAQVVDQAYQGLVKALQQQLKVRTDLAMSKKAPAAEKQAKQILVQMAADTVEVARAEVERVNALMNYFQLEVMYRSAQAPQS
jgi:hypothetical protein